MGVQKTHHYIETIDKISPWTQSTDGLKDPFKRYQGEEGHHPKNPKVREKLLIKYETKTKQNEDTNGELMDLRTIKAKLLKIEPKSFYIK